VALLDIESVTVRFGGHLALHDVTLGVEPKSITGLIGPNGAGKTTLFNVITGLQTAARGHVSLNGTSISSLAPHHRAQRGLARTFQRIELFGSLSAAENLLVAAEIRRSWGEHDGSAADRVEVAIDQVGMRAIADVRADQLTTGQARLVELGRALVTQPRVLLLDEPASGLDTDETDAFAEIILKLPATGVSVLLVEHDIPLVMKTCEIIYVLDFGRIIASGDPEAIRHNPQVIEAYLGAPGVSA
jgi:branched-chain amino acid transport system ATP-binding protein